MLEIQKINSQLIKRLKDEIEIKNQFIKKSNVEGSYMIMKKKLNKKQ